MTRSILFFFFKDTAPTEIYPLSLHDALPICNSKLVPMASQLRLKVIAPDRSSRSVKVDRPEATLGARADNDVVLDDARDRKSTRLNSSHSQISYAVFCLKKKRRS